jgi:hypothetical protein
LEKLLENVDWNVEVFLVFLSVFFVTTTTTTIITTTNTSILTIITVSFSFFSTVYVPAIMNWLVSGTVEYSRGLSVFRPNFH